MRNNKEYKNSIDRSARRKRGGFSLVEMVIAIGILAVLVAILVPAMISYTERTRAQRDDSAASEIVNAFQLALADERVFDDVVAHNRFDNVSCYIDSPTESRYTPIVNKLGSGKTVNQYTFDNDSRRADETPFYAAGNMRGVTITFIPEHGQSQDTSYSIKNGEINKFMKGDRKLTIAKDCAYLYSAVKAIVGDYVYIDSQTYRNSDFTVFIRIGSTGGAQSDAQDAILVYGQFSGTNLSEATQVYRVADDRVVGEGSEDAGENTNDGGGSGEANVDEGLLIGGGIFIGADEGLPAGGFYYVGVTTNTVGDYDTATATYSIGDELPDISDGDIFVYGDYEYRYNYYFDGSVWVHSSSYNGNGWGARVLDNKKMQYGTIVTSVNGKDVTTLRCTFINCKNLITGPIISTRVTKMRSTFNGCENLIKAPTLPEGVTDLRASFKKCKRLESFEHIPYGVTDMHIMFNDCVSLTGVIDIDAISISEGNRTYVFKGTKKMIYLSGDSPLLEELAATDGYTDMSENDNVRLAEENPGGETQNMIPYGATYYVGVGKTTTGDYSGAKEVFGYGQKFPEQVNPGDIFVYGDYEYRYQYYWNSTTNKWEPYGSSPIGGWRARVINTKKSTYTPIMASINGKNVTDLTRTYMNCTNMVASPNIPSSVHRFDQTYLGCTKLATPPVMSPNVSNMNGTFYGCTSLSGVVEIGANVTVYGDCFRGTSKQIYVTGDASATTLAAIAKTDGYSDGSARDNVQVLNNSKQTAQYIVKHWQQNVTGDASKKDMENYTVVESQKQTGVVGSIVTPSIRSYAGFTSPTATISTVVEADGTAVVNYYYTRITYYIDVNLKWDGTSYTSIGAAQSPILFDVYVNGKLVKENAADYYVKWPHGSTYSIEVKPKSGYTFKGLTSSSSPLQGTINAGTASIWFNVETNVQSSYTVNHWTQNLGGNADAHNEANYTLERTDHEAALAGASVSPQVRSFPGFTAPARKEVIVAKNGKTVVNYYYTRNNYRLDCNLILDNVTLTNGVSDILFTVTIDGQIVAKDVTDFCRDIPYGSTYKVDIKVSDKYTWSGNLSPATPTSGTITTYTALNFVIYTKP